MNSAPSDLHPVREPDEGQRLCDLLSRGRQQRGVTLQRIAEDTKIPVRHLAALERGDLSLLPGGLYRRAEVRAFARAVGVDERAAVDLLERLEVPAPVEAPPLPPQRAGRTFTRARIELAVGLGIVAAVVFGRIFAERRAIQRDAGAPARSHVIREAAAPSAVTPRGDDVGALMEGAHAGAPRLEIVPATLPSTA